MIDQEEVRAAKMTPAEIESKLRVEAASLVKVADYWGDCRFEEGFRIKSALLLAAADYIRDTAPSLARLRENLRERKERT